MCNIMDIKTQTQPNYSIGNSIENLNPIGEKYPLTKSA